MDIMTYVQAGLVLAVVIIIQSVKMFLDSCRAKKQKPPINGDLWHLIVFLCGFPMALIVQGGNGFKDFNVFTFIRDAFIYAAAASFTYRTYIAGMNQLSKSNSGTTNGQAG